MDLKEIAIDIRNVLEEKRSKLRLSFVENKHVYYMMDNTGKIRSNFPSVTKLIKKFHQPFDADGISLKMAKGDKEEQRKLLAEWKLAGDLSVNLGSRTHYELEKHLVEMYDNYKNVREPKFSCNNEQIDRSDNMILAGKKYIDLMHERGAVSLDTELVMGETSEGYVGQCDNAWIMENKDKTDIGFVFTDYKTNQKKNFIPQPFNGKMYEPFQSYTDYALTHYFLQIPFYGRLLTSMLKGTKYEDKKFLGGVVVLLKDDGTFEEFRVPQSITNTVLSMNLKPYLK